jgi:Holliday junction resolvase RusA-like endonuclease
MNALTFTVPWRVTSNNVAARRVGRAMIPNPAATRDKQRIWQIAFAAAKEQGWKMPDAAALYIVAYGTRKDVGNIEKIISDALSGVAWIDDRIVTELHVEKKRDLGEERYDVRVEPRPVLEKPKPLRTMRWSDVDEHDYDALFDTWPGAVIAASGCHPMPVKDVPQVWRDRARKHLNRTAKEPA